MNTIAELKTYLLKHFDPKKQTYENMAWNINILFNAGWITADQRTELQKWAYLNFCK